MREIVFAFAEYINLRSSPGPVTICFTLGSAAFDRNWKIRIVQLQSNSLCAAPEACQQVECLSFNDFCMLTIVCAWFL